jgi:hypothetical protein
MLARMEATMPVREPKKAAQAGQMNKKLKIMIEAKTIVQTRSPEANTCRIRSSSSSDVNGGSRDVRLMEI